MGTDAESILEGFEQYPTLGPDLYLVDREVDGVTVIDLVGPLVREPSVHALADRIQELLDKGVRGLAINLAEVPYADSYGVGGLVAAGNSVRQAGGKIRFFAGSERLVRTLERPRLDRVLNLYEDESSALSSFENSS